MRSIGFLAALMLVLLGHTQAWANVTVPDIFSQGAVLQRQMPIPVWGKADPGEKVTVTLSDESVAATADAQGNWKVMLSPREAGGPFTLSIEASNKLVIEDILIGEVWLCSGQSNMAWQVKSSANAEKEIAQANHPQIRQFLVSRSRQEQPQENARGSWTSATPANVGRFTAVGYYFGRDLHQELGVPVGLINSSVGGTIIEAWMSRAALDSSPDFKPVLERHEGAIKAFAEYQAKKAAATADKPEAAPATATQPAAQDDSGQTNNRQAKPAQDPKKTPNAPSVLYNGMIHPLVPYGIRGVIWYQGESNISRASEYRKLFTAMISDWRSSWGQGDFPFLFVQLANYRNNEGWLEIWEAQTQTWQSVPNTGMAAAVDIGMTNNIHPINKQDVGKRLALFAKRLAYGKDVQASGPVFDTMTVQDDKAVLTFKHAESGLVVKGDGPLTLFEIAGEDNVYFPASARITGKSVEVWSDKVKKPTAVRFAWNPSAPGFNFYNNDNLPAVPFRTSTAPAAKPRQ